MKSQTTNERTKSMITACIVLLYISYAIPVICLLLRGRNNIAHSPFWLGPIGLFANIVLLCWTLFTLVMYSFPYVQPVAAGNMNYVSAVYFVVVVIVVVDWFARGRRSYRSQSARKEEIEEVARREIVVLRRESEVRRASLEGVPG